MPSIQAIKLPRGSRLNWCTRRPVKSLIVAALPRILLQLFNISYSTTHVAGKEVEPVQCVRLRGYEERNYVWLCKSIEVKISSSLVSDHHRLSWDNTRNSKYYMQKPALISPARSHRLPYGDPCSLTTIGRHHCQRARVFQTQRSMYVGGLGSHGQRISDNLSTLNESWVGMSHAHAPKFLLVCCIHPFPCHAKCLVYPQHSKNAFSSTSPPWLGGAGTWIISSSHGHRLYRD